MYPDAFWGGGKGLYFLGVTNVGASLWAAGYDNAAEEGKQESHKQ